LLVSLLGKNESEKGERVIERTNDYYHIRDVGELS